MKKVLYVFLLGLVSAWPSNASASPVTLSYTCVTDNPTDCALAEGQIYTEVLDLGGGLVGFNFYNTGSSALTDVYARDLRGLLTFDSIEESAGVAFSLYANPSDPPGINGFTLGFSADSDPPVAPNGVSLGENLLLKFFADYGLTLLALNKGDLSWAGHAQDLPDGRSVTIVNDPPPAEVPEPAVLSMFGLGLLWIVKMAKERRLATVRR